MKTFHSLIAKPQLSNSIPARGIAYPALVLSAAIFVQLCGAAPHEFENAGSDQANGGWTVTGSMATVRREHTATLLQNGKVLVAGGFNNAIGEVATAELYDPTTGTWTNTGNLSIARHGHTATLLPNGKVLVAGGYNEVQTLAQAELYDPATGTWTNTGHLNDTRGHHTATLLPNGKLLVAGGYIYTNGQSQYLSSAELYDPASGTWTLTGSLTITRSSHTATLLPNGNVLVAGGRNDDRVLSIAELYDPLSGSWATTGSLSQRRYVHTATLLSTGKVLVAGGANPENSPLKSAELYDPTTGTWTETAALASARWSHTATLLANGQVLVAGGHALDVFDGSPPGIASYALKRTELYDPTLGTWTAAGRLTTGREQHTATLLPDGQVLVTGGYSSRDTTLGSAELFDSGGN